MALAWAQDLGQGAAQVAVVEFEKVSQALAALKVDQGQEKVAGER